ncbi:MAG: tetratricopeptide repeat protein [Ignavibacteriales bacterium]|nr:tetratricopeptide repeat protein [Ignavibacteriales bacterium]
MLVGARKSGSELDRRKEQAMCELFENVDMFVDDPMVYSETLFAEGLSLEETEEHEKAIPLFEEYSRFHPEDPKGYYEHARCNFNLKRYDIALDLVNRAILLDPEYGDAYGLRGLIFIEKHEYGKARGSLEYANAIVPCNKTILVGLLRAFHLCGFYDSSMIIVKQLHAICPTDLVLRTHEACLCGLLGQYDKAIPLIEELIAEYPTEQEYREFMTKIQQWKKEDEGCRYPGMKN